MDFANYYAILGVPHTASEEEIKESFRLAARRVPPEEN